MSSQEHSTSHLHLEEGWLRKELPASPLPSHTPHQTVLAAPQHPSVTQPSTNNQRTLPCVSPPAPRTPASLRLLRRRQPQASGQHTKRGPPQSGDGLLAPTTPSAGPVSERCYLNDPGSGRHLTAHDDPAATAPRRQRLRSSAGPRPQPSRLRPQRACARP